MLWRCCCTAASHNARLLHRKLVLSIVAACNYFLVPNNMFSLIVLSKLSFFFFFYYFFIFYNTDVTLAVLVFYKRGKSRKVYFKTSMQHYQVYDSTDITAYRLPRASLYSMFSTWSCFDILVKICDQKEKIICHAGIWLRCLLACFVSVSRKGFYLQYRYSFSNFPYDRAINVRGE